MKYLASTSLSAGLVAMSLGAIAVAQTDDMSGDPALDALLECRTIAGESERLACQDEYLAQVAEAIESGSLVVVQSQSVREVQRDAFGLSMPSLSGLGGIFRRGESDSSQGSIEFEDGVAAETNDAGDLSALRGLVVANVETNRADALVITLENGQVWLQTDRIGQIRVSRRRMRDGVTAEIESGALGSYFMTLSANPRRFRVRRIQ